MQLMDPCIRLLAKSEKGHALVDALQDYIDEHGLDPETGVAVDIYNAVIVPPPVRSHSGCGFTAGRRPLGLAGGQLCILAAL